MNSLVVLAAVAATVSPVPVPRVDPPAVSLDSRRVGWRELHFAAHKLGISALVDVRWAEAADPADPNGARAGGPEIVLESTSRLAGRVFNARERIDPVQARAREIVDTATGLRHHRKTYTLARRGFMYDLLEPASMLESDALPEKWTRQTRTFEPYPRALAADAVVTGPVGLLYAASAARLAAPGDTLTIHVLVQKQIERVAVTVEGVQVGQLDFLAYDGDDSTQVRGEHELVRLVARSQPLDPDAASSFRLFGLEGDVEILWDPVRRLPVKLSGQVKLLGHVEVRLVAARVR